MNIKNIRFARAIIVAIIMILICVELPYSDKSIIQYLIPAIRLKSNGLVNTSIYLSGFVPLIGLIWSYNEICKSHRVNSSRLKIFVIMFLLIIPFIMNNVDIIKVPIYYLNSGIKSIEIKDSNLRIINVEGKEKLKIELEMKSYRNNTDGFQIAIILSDTLGNYLQDSYLLLEDKIRLGNNQHTNFTETIELKPTDYYEFDDLFYNRFYNDDYKIVLIDKNDSIELTRNDSY